MSENSPTPQVEAQTNFIPIEAEMHVSISGAELELVSSLMIDLLHNRLNVSDIEEASDQVHALDREIEIAVKNQNPDLDYWKWQYAALRNLKIRAEKNAHETNQIQSQSIADLLREG